MSPDRVKCDYCGIDVEIDINDAAKKASERGIPEVLTFDHGDHLLMIFVDGEANTWSRTFSKKPGRVVEVEIPVPVKNEEMPSTDRLPREKLAILALCDGNRSIERIAGILGMPKFKVRITTAELLSKGYLKELRREVKVES